MSKYWINLFPLKVEWDNLNLYKYSVSLHSFGEKIKVLNRLRFTLVSETKSPAFYHQTPEGAIFYTFNSLKGDIVKLSEEKVYHLPFEGTPCE